MPVLITDILPVKNLYRIAENFGDQLILVIWCFNSHLPN